MEVNVIPNNPLKSIVPPLPPQRTLTGLPAGRITPASSAAVGSTYKNGPLLALNLTGPYGASGVQKYLLTTRKAEGEGNGSPNLAGIEVRLGGDENSGSIRTGSTSPNREVFRKVIGGGLAGIGAFLTGLGIAGLIKNNQNETAIGLTAGGTLSLISGLTLLVTGPKRNVD